MTQEIIIPRGHNVGTTIQNKLQPMTKVIEVVSLKRDLINKCIIATVALSYLLK